MRIFYLHFRVIEQLGGKQLVMNHMHHEDQLVRYNALLCVQKLMVHNWYDPFLPFLHVKSEKTSIYHQICWHKMGIRRLFYSMWSEMTVGVDFKIGIKVWGLFVEFLSLFLSIASLHRCCSSILSQGALSCQ